MKSLETQLSAYLGLTQSAKWLNHAVRGVSRTLRNWLRVLTPYIIIATIAWGYFTDHLGKAVRWIASISEAFK